MRKDSYKAIEVMARNLDMALEVISRFNIGDSWRIHSWQITERTDQEQKVFTFLLEENTEQEYEEEAVDTYLAIQIQQNDNLYK